MMKLPFLPKKPTVSTVRLSGMISASGRGSLNDRAIGPVLDRAFKKGKPSAVALLINSPGGSPVQSSLIGARIRRLADETKVPVYAFVEDVAASGGYWIAVAADEIYADATSIVGSVGVISAGFGFQDFITRHGVERRVHTAGKSKSTLDPFQPQRPEDVERLKRILNEMHGAFQDHITARRGARLVQDQDLFTGEFWTGQSAVDLGLIDGMGHMDDVLRKRFGEKLRYRHYGVKKSLGQRIGMAVADDMTIYVQERAAFAQFGL